MGRNENRIVFGQTIPRCRIESHIRRVNLMARTIAQESVYSEGQIVKRTISNICYMEIGEIDGCSVVPGPCGRIFDNVNGIRRSHDDIKIEPVNGLITERLDRVIQGSGVFPDCRQNDFTIEGIIRIRRYRVCTGPLRTIDPHRGIGWDHRSDGVEACFPDEGSGKSGTQLRGSRNQHRETIARVVNPIDINRCRQQEEGLTRTGEDDLAGRIRNVNPDTIRRFGPGSIPLVFHQIHFAIRVRHHKGPEDRITRHAVQGQFVVGIDIFFTLDHIDIWCDDRESEEEGIHRVLLKRLGTGSSKYTNAQGRRNRHGSTIITIIVVLVTVQEVRVHRIRPHDYEAAIITLRETVREDFHLNRIDITDRQRVDRYGIAEEWTGNDTRSIEVEVHTILQGIQQSYIRIRRISRLEGHHNVPENGIPLKVSIPV